MTDRTPIPAELLGTPASEGAGATEPGASNAQLSFLSGLLNERDIPEDARRSMLDRVDLQVALNEREGDRAPVVPAEGVTLRRAQDWIGRLKDKPKTPGGVAFDKRLSVQYKELELDSGTKRVGAVVGGESPVLRGHYALDTSGSGEFARRFTNDTTFFHVWVGSRGGWKVYLHVSDDDRHEVPWPLKRDILLAIARDPAAASARFGHEKGRCGVCGRGLTNDLSRELGIGPVCRSRVGAW